MSIAAKNALAERLAAAVDGIRADVERIGPRPRGNPPGEFRATVVIRHTGNDHATMVFGQDDEATLIVALQTLGGSAGRKHYRADRDGLREGEE